MVDITAEPAQIALQLVALFATDGKLKGNQEMEESAGHFVYLCFDKAASMGERSKAVEEVRIIFSITSSGQPNSAHWT